MNSDAADVLGIDKGTEFPRKNAGLSELVTSSDLTFPSSLCSPGCENLEYLEGVVRSREGSSRKGRSLRSEGADGLESLVKVVL